MELDSFLASPRWDILRVIIEKPSSPTEIADKIGTTMSFVSQQLKLLEATGIVKRERTGEVNKGKPRTIFSISEESFYMIPLSKELTQKKLVPLTLEHKIIIQIWGIEDSTVQPIIEKFFWSIQKYLSLIDGIVVYTKKKKLKIYLISKDADLTHKINETQKNMDGYPEFQVTTYSSLSKLEHEYLVPIYDPQGIVAEEELKGGLR
jgi:predicted transcriptional regulator